MGWMDDIPVGVTINECVNLAKEFSTDNSGAFVNGLLSSCNRYFQQKASEETTEDGEHN